MRIINIPEKEIVCKHCGTTLAYDFRDIKFACNNVIRYIVCPVCNENILESITE